MPKLAIQNSQPSNAPHDAATVNLDVGSWRATLPRGDGSSEMNEMHLLIATAGRADLLGSTLRSLAACDIPASLASVIVIENGPACGSELVCRQSYGDLNVRYAWTPEPNKSLALNTALQQIPDRSLIVFSDDDIRFTPKTLLAFEQSAANAAPNKFFGGPFGCDYEVAPPPWILPYLPLSAIGWQPNEKTFDPRSGSFLGFNWAAYCYDIKRLGGFDPNFGPGSPTGATGQESNMQRRMRAAGMTAQLVPDAHVFHFVPANRCSIDWAVHRARRNGISRGVAYRNRSVPEIALSLWGYSIGLLTSTAAKALTRSIPDSRLHFHARYRQQKALGYFSGFRTEPTAVATQRAA